ncbi:MAG: hypothetical protein ABW063_13630 [Caulobacter sp.]
MGQTFFSATAKAANAKNAPPPSARKIRSAIGSRSSLEKLGVV